MAFSRVSEFTIGTEKLENFVASVGVHDPWLVEGEIESQISMLSFIFFCFRIIGLLVLKYRVDILI